MTPTPRNRLVINEAESLLKWVAEAPASVELDHFEVVDVWALVALAVLARAPTPTMPLAVGTGASGASRFAHAVGIEGAVAGAQSMLGRAEPRTVRLARVVGFDQVEPIASAISRLIVGPSAELEETQRSTHYVLVELLRNVVQHSRDPLGGIVAAQRMDQRNGYSAPAIQVAVGDAGIGIPAAIRGMHPDAVNPEAALDKALWPHVSGAFPEGESGTSQNAGLGLFFIAEMAKRTAGRLVIASRGAALDLSGDLEGGEQHRMQFMKPRGLGFPGTLVGFELREGEVRDHEGLLQVIRALARQRTPQRAIHRWLRFEQPPPEVQVIRVAVAAEDTSAALKYSARVFMPRLLARKSVALDFAGWTALTQSYAHALLYEPLRVAWALRQDLFILNSEPAVRSALEFLESYALGG